MGPAPSHRDRSLFADSGRGWRAGSRRACHVTFLGVSAPRRSRYGTFPMNRRIYWRRLDEPDTPSSATPRDSCGTFRRALARSCRLGLWGPKPDWGYALRCYDQEASPGRIAARARLVALLVAHPDPASSYFCSCEPTRVNTSRYSSCAISLPCCAVRAVRCAQHRRTGPCWRCYPGCCPGAMAAFLVTPARSCAGTATWSGESGPIRGAGGASTDLTRAARARPAPGARKSDLGHRRIHGN
jgi:hypothetical protein